MIKVNEYLAGKVKSLGAEYKGAYFTAGIMLRGEYEFTTEKKEYLVVTLGEFELQIPGGSWKKYLRGDTATVPEKTKFQLRVRETVSYVCFYGSSPI